MKEFEEEYVERNHPHHDQEYRPYRRGEDENRPPMPPHPDMIPPQEMNFRRGPMPPHPGMDHPRGPHPEQFHEREEFYEREKMENGDDLGFLLHACARRLNHRGGRKNSQVKVLHILAKEDIIPQQKLQEILDIKPGSLSELLLKLETKGYIERLKSETDKRRTYVRITEEGRYALDEMREENNEDRFSSLTEEEQESLRILLKKLLDSESKDD